MRRRVKEELVAGLYVDDLIVTGTRAEDIDSFKREMTARFRMSNLGTLSYYLSIEVRQGKEALTLAETDEGQYHGEGRCTLYRSIVDGLRYLVHMRPDIAFVGDYVSRFMEDPREDHWAAVKRLLRYVKGTVNQGIVSPKTVGSGL
ncbi:uncharacterized mitochondrial protein AtMg00810-like [Miscanthus floridulus]|uniref:uncharacterized mitochondrial protein AtMg00810-like n=1 Tax=Miscanthus floridulus TaxID=154761 RepID=UPI00345B0A59